MPSAYFDGDARQGRPLLLRRARLIDPAGGRDFVGDILAARGEIVAARPVVDGVSGGCMVVDAGGPVVCPGFKETIDTGARVGARGGFTARCCMPNADPPIDWESVNGGQVAAGVAVRMAALCQLNAGEGA